MMSFDEAGNLLDTLRVLLLPLLTPPDDDDDDDGGEAFAAKICPPFKRPHAILDQSDVMEYGKETFGGICDLLGEAIADLRLHFVG